LVLGRRDNCKAVVALWGLGLDSTGTFLMLGGVRDFSEKEWFGPVDHFLNWVRAGSHKLAPECSLAVSLEKSINKKRIYQRS
jgi:hypothetical protein